MILLKNISKIFLKNIFFWHLGRPYQLLFSSLCSKMSKNTYVFINPQIPSQCIVITYLHLHTYNKIDATAATFKHKCWIKSWGVMIALVFFAIFEPYDENKSWWGRPKCQKKIFFKNIFEIFLSKIKYLKNIFHISKGKQHFWATWRK